MKKWEQAYPDWKKGISYQEIAQRYGVCENTVKSWARHKWKPLEEKGKQENERKEEVARERKGEGRLWNSGVVHKRLPWKQMKLPYAKDESQAGDFSEEMIDFYEMDKIEEDWFNKMFSALLSPEEQTFLLDTAFDEAEELRRMIRLCDLQIMKLMKKISELEKKADVLIVDGVRQSKVEDCYGNLEKNTVTTNTKTAHNFILRYNAEIERVKSQKIKCLDKLLLLVHNEEKILIQKQRLTLLQEKHKMETGREEKESKVNVRIYLPENNRN